LHEVISPARPRFALQWPAVFGSTLHCHTKPANSIVAGLYQEQIESHRKAMSRDVKECEIVDFDLAATRFKNQLLEFYTKRLFVPGALSTRLPPRLYCVVAFATFPLSVPPALPPLVSLPWYVMLVDCANAGPHRITIEATHKNRLDI